MSVALNNAGCDRGVLNPKGSIGLADKQILLNSLSIMLAIVIPTIIATVLFVWWFRSGNRRAVYRPDWAYSGQIELVTWTVPSMIVLLLGTIAWVGSHDLDPAKPISSVRPPLEVQVISLDWKWLFIYPDLGIASVNRLIVPANTTVHFRLTSASVMNSFFVPQLGSQIYTMAGMVSQLYLQASEAGQFQGFSAQYSGDGFADMRFEVDAIAASEFSAWVNGQLTNAKVLDQATYAQLARPSSNVDAATFGKIEPGLFEAVVHFRATSLILATGTGGHMQRTR